MAWSRAKTQFHRVVYAIAGLACLIVPMAHRLPTAADLVEVAGRLRTYRFHDGGHGRYDVLLSIEGTTKRYWTDALSRGEADALFNRPGPVNVRLFAEVQTRYGLTAGAQKSWGLWVDGREIKSLQAALERDVIFAHYVMPLFGSAFFLLTLGLGRRLAKKEASPSR
jgi:hypothetical protein